MAIKIGDRVGAVLSADSETVRLLGYGSYAGREIPESGLLHDVGMENPKIMLDDGFVVWGYQCWWAPEEEVRELIGGRKVVMATVNE